MARLVYSSVIAAPIEQLWALHQNPDVLTRIQPPLPRLRWKTPPPALRAGVAFTIELQVLPLLWIPWETRITTFTPPTRFVDMQGATGPFAAWEHEHRFEAVTPNTTRLTDTVDYTPPLGVLGRLADLLFLRWMFRALFAYRHARTRSVLRHYPRR